jgi:ubiquinone/menaquinone biosynthesis C-methylase UbiE
VSSRDDWANSAAGVDALDRPGKFRSDLILGMCDPREDDRYLDVGTGLGTVARMIGPHVGVTVGVDGGFDTVGMLRVRVKGAHPVVADAARLPFSGNVFTLASCAGLLHHAIDPSAVLCEIADAMCPGGRLLVIEQAGREHPVLRSVRNEVERARDVGHRRVLAPSQVRDLLEGAGFEVQGEERETEDVRDDEWARRAAADPTAVRAAIRRHEQYAAGFLALRWVGDAYVFRRERAYVAGVKR